MTRIFLAVVGAAYVGLAFWCAFWPKQTSVAVGFDLKPGAGQSEFLTVYGGLELALGIIFIWPVFRPDETAFSLLACLVIHACLVVFRTAGFFVFQSIPAATYGLAAVEWAILICAAFCFWRQ